MTTKKLAASAVMTALLIAVQYIFGFVSGIELVTVFLLCFCYTFGVVCGMITATAFSLVRCLIFGFAPNVIVLYLIYYNFFALLFGALGRKKIPLWVPPLVLSCLIVMCAYFASAGIPVSIFVKVRISAMLWTLYAILSLILAFYVGIILYGKGNTFREIASVTALAAFCTVMFTLLDDVISPLMLGYSFKVAEIYFYNSFMAMLPQTICAAVSVAVLFLPLTSLLKPIAAKTKSNAR